MLSALKAGAVGALLAAMPAAAYEDLIRFAAVFPTGIDNPYVFDYAAPPAGFGADGAAAYGPSDIPLASALRAASKDPVTGIDFSRVTAVLTAGNSPSTITVLVGAEGFDSGVASALAKRGFAASEVTGVPVLAWGEDHAISLADALAQDPLGGGMGRSQRLALGGDFVLRSSAWPEMRAALAALPRPSDEANLWGAMVEGLRASAGHDAHLSLASGWTVSAFFDPGPGIESLSDPAAVWESRGKPAPPPAQQSVAFPFALFAVTELDGAVSLSIAVPFADDAGALAAGEIIADRVAAHPDTPSAPRTDMQYIEPYSISVVSLDFATAAQAVEHHSRWLADIHRRRFHPLMLGP